MFIELLVEVDEVKQVRFLILFNCFLIGVVIVLVSVLVEVFGQVVVISIVGGVICGYCVIGKICEVISLVMMMMIERIDVKIG